MLRKENAPVCAGAKYKRSTNFQYKPFSPFGKQILKIRQADLNAFIESRTVTI